MAGSPPRPGWKPSTQCFITYRLWDCSVDFSPRGWAEAHATINRITRGRAIGGTLELLPSQTLAEATGNHLRAQRYSF